MSKESDPTEAGCAILVAVLGFAMIVWFVWVVVSGYQDLKDRVKSLEEKVEQHERNR